MSEKAIVYRIAEDILSKEYHCCYSPRQFKKRMEVALKGNEVLAMRFYEVWARERKEFLNHLAKKYSIIF